MTIPSTTSRFGGAENVAGIPAPEAGSRFVDIQVRDGDRLLGIIRHEGGLLLALGPRGKRLGLFKSAASARRMIVANAAFNIIDADYERQRRRRLRKQPWKRRRSK